MADPALQRMSRKQSQARTRKALLEAAAVAFRRDGFHRASAEAIAADAGFTRGALYANFAGKEGLFLAVMDAEITRKYAVFAKALTAEAFAETHLRLVDEDPAWILVLLEFTIHAARTPGLREQLIEQNQVFRARVASMLQDAHPQLSAAQAASAARFVAAIQDGAGLERALDPRSILARDLIPAARAVVEG